MFNNRWVHDNFTLCYLLCACKLSGSSTLHSTDYNSCLCNYLIRQYNSRTCVFHPGILAWNLPLTNAPCRCYINLISRDLKWISLQDSRLQTHPEQRWRQKWHTVTLHFCWMHGINTDFKGTSGLHDLWDDVLNECVIS